jgi:DNA-binding GntR family transcriptional regulator
MTTDLATKAYYLLREEITSGVLVPNTPLVEDALADRLGVSRTPVRTAISRLTHEGFAEAVGKRGVVVTRLSLSDMLEVFDVREGLESVAAGLAASRISDETLGRLDALLSVLEAKVAAGEPLTDAGDDIHVEVLAVCGNQRLVNILDVHRALLARIDAAARAVPSRLETSLVEHRAILEALKARDAEEASATTRAHIRSTRRSLISAYN